MAPRLTLDEVREAGYARGLELGPLSQEQADYVAELLAPYRHLLGRERPAEPQAA